MNQSFDGDDVKLSILDSFEHRHVVRLLPWWVNGTLTMRERERVQRHTQQCVDCRREITLLSECNRALREEPISSSNVDDALASVMARIDSTTGGAETVDNQSHLWKSWHQPDRHESGSLRWMAVAAAIAAIAVMLFPLRSGMPPDPHSADYSVLNSSEVVNSGFLLKVDWLEGMDSAEALRMLRNALTDPSVITQWTATEQTSGLLVIDGSIESSELMSILESLSDIDRVMHVEMLTNE